MAAFLGLQHTLEHPYTRQIRAQIVHKLQVVDGEGNILKGIPADREGVDHLQFRFQQTRGKAINWSGVLIPARHFEWEKQAEFLLGNTGIDSRTKSAADLAASRRVLASRGLKYPATHFPHEHGIIVGFRRWYPKKRIQSRNRILKIVIKKNVVHLSWLPRDGRRVTTKTEKRTRRKRSKWRGILNACANTLHSIYTITVVNTVYFTILFVRDLIELSDLEVPLIMIIRPYTMQALPSFVFVFNGQV